MADPLDYTGKEVLVIGGSGGIGLGIARSFSDAGAQVRVTGTRDAPSAYPESDLSGLAYSQLDVTDRKAVAALDSSRLDVAVLCQGAVRYGRAEFEAEGWDAVLEVNLTSLMDCARTLKPALVQGSSLIVVSSVGAYHAMVGNPAYGASKAGAVHLVTSLAAAWAGDGIRVNGIAPGLVETRMTRVTFDNAKRREGALRSIPARRFGTPEDMGGAALFLASPLADYIHGQTLRVDGGMTLS